MDQKWIELHQDTHNQLTPVNTNVPAECWYIWHLTFIMRLKKRMMFNMILNKNPDDAVAQRDVLKNQKKETVQAVMTGNAENVSRCPRYEEELGRICGKSIQGKRTVCHISILIGDSRSILTRNTTYVTVVNYAKFKKQKTTVLKCSSSRPR